MRRVVSFGMLMMAAAQLTLSACGRATHRAGGAGSAGTAGSNAVAGSPSDAGTAGTAGSNATAGSPSDAGTAGTAGSAAAGGAGGNAGGPPNPFPPGCVRELQARCALKGSCRYEATDTGRPLRSCYDSGERIEYEYNTPDTIECQPGTSVTQVFGTDGTLCYSVQYDLGAGCESTSVTYRNADGEKVAIGGQPFNSRFYTLNCVATDEQSHCNRADAGQPCPAADSCEPGACP
jgi:hypothetical protein